ncbi:HEPN domain-containing protein [Candidatus Woesearchaeota archaeon]|nr:HEPN domain-containing protein [Candidatus Woesearchaeota archaeon]
MISPFENYLETGKVKRKTPDYEEAKALFEQSKERMDYTKLKDISQKTAKFVLQDSYEAVREAAQSLMSIHGFKPYSHEATISFIKKFYSADFSEEEIHKFDHFRQIRNNSVYKAAKVMEEDAKSSIFFAKKFIQKVQILLNKKE